MAALSLFLSIHSSTEEEGLRKKRIRIVLCRHASADFHEKWALLRASLATQCGSVSPVGCVSDAAACTIYERPWWNRVLLCPRFCPRYWNRDYLSNFEINFIQWSITTGAKTCVTISFGGGEGGKKSRGSEFDDFLFFRVFLQVFSKNGEYANGPEISLFGGKEHLDFFLRVFWGANMDVENGAKFTLNVCTNVYCWKSLIPKTHCSFNHVRK